MLKDSLPGIFCYLYNNGFFNIKDHTVTEENDQKIDEKSLSFSLEFANRDSYRIIYLPAFNKHFVSDKSFKNFSGWLKSIIKKEKIHELDFVLASMQ